MRPVTCRGCPVELVWIFGTKGGRVPVEWESLTNFEQEDVLSGLQVKWRPEMVNHFTTCPERQQFKKKKGAP